MIRFTRRKWIAATVLAIGTAAALIAVRQRYRASARDDVSRATFVGSKSCASCHSGEAVSWKTSQHAHSMEDATPATVLGNFDSTRFSGDGIAATFFRRGDRYVVNTAGSDGARHDYAVRWTFGVFPLQQYIVAVPPGRFQALTIAWDSRAISSGGQRWFFLTPGHGATSADPLHWTGRQYNWNYSCADCHSTAVRKGYDGRTDQFQTTFAEIDVACEACHGPGSAHVKWARYPSLVRSIAGGGNGLLARLDERRGATWVQGSPTGTAYRSIPRRTDREIQVCAQCHSRRLHISDGYVAGADFFDHYIPVTIADMYYPDGQQRGEVYNYGSFIQSRMYAAGVTCSDCHDPHTAKLRRPGNQVCAQCHAPSKYDTSDHHHHIIAGTTGTCVSCHMPATTYMEIDPRPDHSMRIPRPDLTLSIGVPNACNRCHSGKDAEWAATWINSWYPNPNPGFQRFAEAFAADDRNDSSAAPMLARVANDSTEPWFVRASALGRLASHPGPLALEAARQWARDPRPLIRLAALEIAEASGAAARLELGTPMLTDSTLAVRKGAAWLLAPVADSLDPADRRRFDAAAREFVASQLYNADQPGDRFVLGIFYAQLGEFRLAETQLLAALKLNPRFTDADLVLQRIRTMKESDR